jgi:Domain of unknown function (DUF6894)
MPVFRFKTRHGRDVFEGDGIELGTLRDAWKEATSAAGEILKDIDVSLDPDREWRMDVMDEAGRALFSLRLIPETHVEGRKLKGLQNVPSSTRFIAGISGFSILIHRLDLPDSYGRSFRFATIPSWPNLHA